MDKIKVPFVDLGRFYKKHREKILELTDQVGNSGIYILGNIVEEFERDFATYCGVNHAYLLAMARMHWLYVFTHLILVQVMR